MLKLANVFAVCLFTIGVMFYLFFFQRPETSGIESRTLDKFPEFTFEDLWSGKYTKGISDWFTDTTPGRDDWKRVKIDFESNFGFTPSDEIVIGSPTDTTSEGSRPSIPPIDDTSSNDTSSTDTDVASSVSQNSNSESASSQTEESTNPQEVDVGANGILYVGKGDTMRAIEPFGGVYENGAKYASYLIKYREQLGNDVNIYSFIIPTAAAYYLPEQYKAQYGGNQTDKIAYIKDCLDQYASDKGVKEINSIDVYNSMLPHKDEPIYYKTEHHWTPLGAYYAARELASTAELSFMDLSEYRVNGKYDENGNPLPFLGSLYGKTQTALLGNSPDEFIYYEYPLPYTMKMYSYNYQTLQREKDSCFMYVSDSNVSSWYMIFMDGDNYSIKIENPNVKNGRVCVVFKDSFGNALVPMMLSSFETIYAIDLRYFPINAIDFINAVDATDVVFSLCAFTPLGSNLKYVESIRTQNQGAQFVAP